MAFNINTNIASLQSQDYLRTTSDFQGKTINRVTSGLRIINSGDDAAGLAIANAFRSDRSVLTQGVRNANDGLSTLQTIDAGINNISQLLDRARTLAAQSASGTFSGSRSVLSTEFQSVIGEIDRQAQSIGLDSNGQFAKALSVFVGGGRTNNGTDAITNGSVAVDLSKSTVDAKSMGLKGVQVMGSTSVDLGAASTTSVQNILADPTNVASQSGTYTNFYFRGPGFSDSRAIKVSVNLNGVNDTGTLVTALNAAIQAAGNGTNAAATAFKNAGISASVVTDANGQHLAFSSSSAAFQAEAGDRTANALLGNLTGVTGASLATTVTASAASDTGTNTFGAVGAGSIVVRFQGAGNTAPVNVTLTTTAAETVTQAIADLSSQVANNASLQASGISLTTNTGSLQFTSTKGEKFSIDVTGDVQNKLGFGSFVAGNAGEFDYTTRQGVAYDRTTARGTATYEFSLNGGASSGNQVAVNLALGDATAGTITGTDNAATVNTSANVNLSLAIDGTVYNLALTSNAAAQKSVLATDIQTAIGANGTASVVNNQIIITSATKGTGSSVQILSAAANDAAATLGLTGSNTGQARSAASVAQDLNNQFSTDAELQAAGLKATVGGSTITIASANNSYFRLDATGTASAASVIGTKSQNFTTVAGTSDAMSITVAGANNGAAQVIALGAQGGVNATVMAGVIQGLLTGVTVTANGGHIKIVSTATGSAAGITINAVANNAYAVLGLTAATTTNGADANLGFGVAGAAAFAGNASSTAPATSPVVNSGGASQSSEFTFTPVLYGNDAQTITVTAVDSTGAEKSQDIKLQNVGGGSPVRNARSLDEAINTINTALQQSNIASLQGVVAVKDDAAGGTEKIRFLSSSTTFKVTVGTNANATGVGSQGATDNSTVSAGGSTADISTQGNAQNAVTALALAVSTLGSAQAVVGKGENQFTYAVNLAQSQLTNLAAAESRIRDADLAQEAANLTRAQILAQAGIAALAQANSAPQAVLSLLRA